MRIPREDVRNDGAVKGNSQMKTKEVFNRDDGPNDTPSQPQPERLKSAARNGGSLGELIPGDTESDVCVMEILPSDRLLVKQQK